MNLNSPLDLASLERPPAAPPRLSIIILTYARDAVLKGTLAALASSIGEDLPLCEVVLVDNNADEVDRSVWLGDFPQRQYLKTGENRGISARNDGLDIARGELLAALDDDVLVQTPHLLPLIEGEFARNPKLGVLMPLKLDHRTMKTRFDFIPHTRKNIDVSRPFDTFRFVGGCVVFRRDVHRQLNGYSRDIFYGMDEIEYSYRIVEAGWSIRFVPEFVVVELQDPKGRKSRREVDTKTLTSKFFTSYLHMPFPHVIVNMILFPFYFYKVGGRADFIGAWIGFLRWLGRTDRPQRNPIGREARAYIKACGGQLWR